VIEIYSNTVKCLKCFNTVDDTLKRMTIRNETSADISDKMVKTGQFTTKCKGDRVIALKRQKSLWWDSA